VTALPTVSKLLRFLNPPLLFLFIFKKMPIFPDKIDVFIGN